jgi:hypothetical protein
MQRCVWSCGIGALVFLETKIERRSRNRSAQLPPGMHNESKMDVGLRVWERSFRCDEQQSSGFGGVHEHHVTLLPT